MLGLLNLINRLKGNKTLLNGSLFSLFSFINQGIAFLLLIILANYIAPAEYGKLSLFNTIVQFMGYFVALSTQGFLSVSYFKRGSNYFKKDFSSICIIGISVTTFFCIINIFVSGWVARQADLPSIFIWFAIFISFFQIFQGMWLDYHRIKENVIRYGIISCSFAIINLVLSLYLVIGAKMNWEGRVYANLICVLLFGILSIMYFSRQKLFVKNVSWNNIKMIALWGVPLIPHLASVWIKQGGDRFIINHYHSVEEVGLFSFALNLTSIIIIIGSAFNSSNSVSIFQILAKDDVNIEEKKQMLRNQTKNISLITLIASVGVIVFGCIVVPLLLPRYTASIPYFIILSLQGIGQCFYFLYCNYLFYYSKNKQIMQITFLTSLMHLLLSFCFTRYSLYCTCIIYVVIQLLVDFFVYKAAKKCLAISIK